MAKIKQFLHNMYNTLSQIVETIVGREEDTELERALPTQRNQYYT